jgi:hypothetical protein
MSRTLLSAFTSFDPTYPPYTNISIEDDEVVVTVRGSAVTTPAGLTDSGATVEHRMSLAEFEKFLDDVNLNFNRARPLSIAPIRDKLDAEEA